MKNKKPNFSRNQMMPGTKVKGTMLSGGSQPPRNSTLIRPQSSMTFIYSPRKKSRNGAEEYSTKKPATNSDSASRRSKGGRCVSASEDMKKMISIGNSSENTFQCAKARIPGAACASTILDRFSEPANNSTVIITKPMETS